MTVYKFCAPTCDGCDDEPTAFPTVAEAREFMRTAGWRKVKGLDYCPTCQAAGYATGDPEHRRPLQSGYSS